MKQLNPLTGLRGIAAYSVLIAHGINASFGYSGTNLWQPCASRLAYFGMSLFFVLSGFVIHYNYAKLISDEGMWAGGYKFMAARFARLYPLYALAIVFFIDQVQSLNWFGHRWEKLAYITLTQSWFNLQMVDFPPAWSISSEWFFYLAFIFLVPLFNKISRPALTLTAYLTLTFLILPYLIQLQISWYGNVNGWVVYFSPFTRIFDFAGGVLASIAYLHYSEHATRFRRFSDIVAILCIVWCVAVISIDPLVPGKYSILNSNFVYVPAIAPILIYCCRFDTWLSRLLCSRSLIFCGEISYSVYLLGFFVISGMASYYNSKEASILAYTNSCIKIMIIIALTSFIAYGSYNLFEKPARSWIRKRLTARKINRLFTTAPEGIAYEAN